jgi:hypothetical protein
VDEQAQAILTQQLRDAVHNGGNVPSRLVFAFSTVGVIEYMPQRRQYMVHRRNGQWLTIEDIRLPHVDDSKVFGVLDLVQQSVGGKNEALVSVEAVVIDAVTSRMNAIDGVDHFTGSMTLTAPQIYQHGRFSVSQQDAPLLQCAQQCFKDQAVGNLRIGVLGKGDEDPAMVDVAAQDRISRCRHTAP